MDRDRPRPHRHICDVPAIAGFLHEAPLHACGETGASSSSEPGDLHLVQDPVGSLQDDLLGLVPVSSSQCSFESGNRKQAMLVSPVTFCNYVWGFFYLQS